MVAPLDPSLPIERVWTADQPRFVWRANGQPLTDDRLIARLNALAVPPAWRPSVFARSGRAKIQARAIDGSGKEQIIYASWFRERREQEKFDALASFGAALPRIRRRAHAVLQKRLEVSEFERAVTACTLLLDETAIRVGTRRYRTQNGTVGAVGLQRRHLRDLSDNRAVFAFNGKGGAKLEVPVRHPLLVAFIQERAAKGGDLFQGRDDRARLRRADQADIARFIERMALAEATGSVTFSPKAFRLWHGSLTALETIIRAPERPSIKAVTSAAARRLCNTPSVARSSYIHPAIIDLLGQPAAFEPAPGRPHFRACEQSLLDLLRRKEKAA